MKRVLYIAHSENVQGAGIALINIISVIRHDEGYDISVLVPGEGPLTAALRSMGVRVYCVKYYPCFFPIVDNRLRSYFTFFPKLFRTLIYNKIAYYKIKEIVLAGKIDIIHSNSGVIRLGYYLSKSLKIKHIWHIREYQTLDFGFKPFGGIRKQKRLVNDSVNTCIAITRGVFDFFNMNSKKDYVIYDGIKIEKTNIIERKENYFLFVGSLLRGKGIFELLSAFEELSLHCTAKLVLAGKDEDYVQEYVEKMKYGNRVEMLGFTKDVYSLMSHARAIIIPSFFEGFGLICVEAMMNHCLVIGRNTAGIKEQFDNGLKKTGHEIGVRFNNLEELVQVMNKVYHNYDFYADTIKYASTAIAGYSIENNGNAIKKIYECN